MENISVAVLSTIISITISYLSFAKNSAKDIKKETTENVELKSRLEYISRGIDDIKLDNRVRDEQIKKLNERVIILENDLKSLSKRFERVDGIKV